MASPYVELLGYPMELIVSVPFQPGSVSTAPPTARIGDAAKAAANSSVRLRIWSFS
jgi:hypothetical protein